MSWFVALVQDADASHANPYACAGSDNAKSSLRLCGLLTLHMQIITLVQAPNNSKNSLGRCRLLTIHTPNLMLVKVPDSLSNSIND
ncbi:hypothetical protein O181_129672 [Austropuccinia psidii MF-1]|uniref:Uncharacterized protein n=1 Tax=Austropuccinia psidii MF-1 TaxID=1389203 RepID=A0A9Q3QBQ1_9BASI|nr:hypothetical protein [Austropuccinia psidii MF-1]